MGGQKIGCFILLWTLFLVIVRPQHSLVALGADWPHCIHVVRLCCTWAMFVAGLLQRSPVFFFFYFVSNLWRFWYDKKAHIFLITHGKFHSWKVFRLEDINENMPCNGYHNKVYTARYRQLQSIFTKFLLTSKWVDRFNWNFKLTYLEWWFFKWKRKLNFEK